MISQRSTGVIAIAGALFAAFFFTSPIPQDPGYHQFADTRAAYGIPNAWNVVSNLPFLVVGLTGLVFVKRFSPVVCARGAEAAYQVFFTGVLLTAFGSGWYHLAPDNETLAWDRLPMSIAFAGLVAIVIAEYLSVRAARQLLLPVVLASVGSVLYWAWTEAAGVGDLRAYAIVQFLPMLLIPVILLVRDPLIGWARVYWSMLAFYLLAKLFEFFDASIFAATGVIGGHALKHLAAAMTPAVFLFGLVARHRRFTQACRVGTMLRRQGGNTAHEQRSEN